MKAILLFTFVYTHAKPEWDELSASTGYELVVIDPISHEEFLATYRKYDVEIIANCFSGAKKMGGWTSDLIEKVNVKAIVHHGSGYDSVGDVHLWHKMGTQVANTPTPVGPPTANAAVALILAAMRKYNRLSRSLRAGAWRGDLTVDECHEPPGAVISIIGMGNIGQMIKQRLLPFGFKKIQYYNRSRLSAEREAGASYVDLDTVWRTSDVIVVSCPLSSSTFHLIGAKEIEQCKDGVTIVNIARGPIIDERALVDGLSSGKVGNVGLDVYEHEPQVSPELLENQNTFLLPHAGALTHSCYRNVELELIANAQSFIDTGKVLNLVAECR